MPKTRTLSHKESKLAPYLRNKYQAKPQKLRDFAIKAPESSTAISTYPASWADPELLSQTSAYQIKRRFTLPEELETLTEQNSHSNVRVCSCKRQKYIAVITPKGTRIYLYNEKPEFRILDLSTAGLSVNGKAPFFNTLTYPESSKLGVLATSTIGEVYYWADCRVDTRRQYKIPLISKHEHITAVKPINENQIILGSSTGEIYYLIIKGDEITASTFYNHSGISNYIAEIFTRKSLPRKTEIEKPSIAGPILNINVIGNDVYFVSSKFIALWNITPENEVKLVSRIHVEEQVTDSVAQHIPSNVSKDYIRSEILDMSVITKEEVVVLASYSVRDMGDYVQYAIITLSLQQDSNDEEDVKNNTAIYVKHTASIPYSAIPTTLKRLPRLSITNSLAFVTFDKNVVAVSLDRKSVFEESVVLRDKDDHVLFTEVTETVEDDKSIDIAVIYTLKSGILEFEIDAHKIQESRATGNIYAGVVDDALERDTLVFKSKLEQAVFFGAAEQSPVQFPLRIEQEDVSKAADSLAYDIISKNCQFLPSTMNADIYVESRYAFMKRIFIVLRENDLLNCLPKENRFALMRSTEFFYLSTELWKLYMKNMKNLITLKYWASSMNAITGLQLDDKTQIETFLCDNAFDLIDFTSKIKSDLLKQSMDIEAKTSLFCTTSKVLLKATSKTKEFEENFYTACNLDNTYGEAISGQFRNMLFSLFESDVKFIQTITSDGVREPSSLDLMKKTVVELATLLLDLIYKAASTNEMNSEDEEYTYKSIRKPVIEGLCLCGLYEKAIDLAEKHNDIPSVVASVQSSKSSPEEIQEKNIHFINLFKTEYFDCLLKYFDSHDQNDAILKLCSIYPGHADPFFAHNELKASWIYYLRQKKYKKSLKSLKLVLDTELNVEERLDKLAWKKMIMVAASPDTSTESLEIKKIDADIDFHSTQLDMIGKIQDYLQFMEESTSESKSTFIFSRCASVLHKSGRTTEIQEMTQSIISLLEGICIEKKKVVKFLVMLDNVGSDIENVWTAINLIHQMRTVGDTNWNPLLNTIWKEVYIRDLNCRYLEIMNDSNYTEAQKTVALQETFLYRVMNLCKIKNAPADDILRPTSLIVTGANEDADLNRHIRLLESTYFMNVLAVIDGKRQLTYEELEDSLKRNTM